MNMKRVKVRDYSEGDPLILQIKEHRDETTSVINFRWPNALEHVCVYKRNLLREEEFDWERPYRKYTKEEYTSFGGFIDTISESGRLEYSVCPLVFEANEAYVIKHTHVGNTIEVTSAKIKINYTLKEKKKIFSNRKTIQISIFCDIDLPKELMCYTKKKGEFPENREDGMQFRFLEDFNAGRNILPEIEVAHDEYIRIYLAEDVRYKELYWLYRQ